MGASTPPPTFRAGYVARPYGHSSMKSVLETQEGGNSQKIGNGCQVGEAKTSYNVSVNENNDVLDLQNVCVLPN